MTEISFDKLGFVPPVILPRALFEEICERDLEGIVAKPAQSPYRTERPLWVKIKNPDYTQAQGRRELFESRRRR